MNVLILTILYSLEQVEGIIGDTKIELKGISLKNYMWFGFEEGGLIESNFTLSAERSTSVDYLICDLEEGLSLEKRFDSEFCEEHERSPYGKCLIAKRIPYYHSQEELISSVEFRSFLFSRNLVFEELSREEQMKQIELFMRETYMFNMKVEEPAIYQFYLIHCEDMKVDIDVEYILMNPNGEHLSVGFIELKYVLNAARVIWSIILGFWVLSWLKVRQTYITLIQALLILNAVIWTAFSWMFHAFWVNYSEEGKPDKDLEFWSFILGILAEGLFFALTEIVCEGNGITKKELSLRAIFIGFFALMVISLFYWLYTLQGTNSLYILAGVYIVLLLGFVVQIQWNIIKLNRELEELFDAGLDPVGSLVWLKLRMFSMIRVSLVIFITFLSGVAIVTIYFLEFYPWIAVSSHLGLLIYSYCVLFYYFQFRKENSVLGYQQEVQNEAPLQRLDLPVRSIELFKVVGDVVVVQMPDLSFQLGIPLLENGVLPEDQSVVSSNDVVIDFK